MFFPAHVCGPECDNPCVAGRKEAGRFARVRQAKTLCNGDAITPMCPVRDECREWSLAVRFPHGIIGGLSERERKRIIKRREAGLPDD